MEVVVERRSRRRERASSFLPFEIRISETVLMALLDSSSWTFHSFNQLTNFCRGFSTTDKSSLEAVNSISLIKTDNFVEDKVEGRELNTRAKAEYLDDNEGKVDLS